MPLRREHAALLKRLTVLLRTKGRIPEKSRKQSGAELKHVDEWGWSDNIVGLAIGWKGREARPCLTVLVKRRYNAARLSAAQFIPEGIRIRRGAEDVLTDVIETRGSARLHAPFSGTVQSGASVGREHGVICPGSAGVLLERTSGETRGVYLLGCAHVLAHPAADFDPVEAGQFIEQPFDPEQDPADRQIAKLTAHFSPLADRRNQTDDFAIARLAKGVAWDNRLKGSTRALTGLSGKAMLADFQRGDAYTHFGAETGPQLGLVSHARGSFVIRSSGHALSNEWVYTGLVPYTAFGIPGDSGGAVIEENGSDLVGLHTGGFTNGSMSFFYPIGPTLQELGFRLVQNRANPAM